METRFVLINFIYYKAETILWMVNRAKLFGLVTKECEERWYRQHRFRSNFPWNEREEKIYGTFTMFRRRQESHHLCISSLHDYKVRHIVGQIFKSSSIFAEKKYKFATSIHIYILSFLIFLLFVFFYANLFHCEQSLFIRKR